MAVFSSTMHDRPRTEGPETTRIEVSGEAGWWAVVILSDSGLRMLMVHFRSFDSVRKVAMRLDR
jgi:hypothetical protein